MISINKILCPVDFFPASDAAVHYATSLAANYEATVHLLHVVTPFIPTGYELAPDMTDVLETMKETSARQLSAVAARVTDAGVAMQSEILVGDAYDEIKRAIEAIKPDLVVMGTHGRRGVERWFMGSTTEKLLRHSPVPLLTIATPGEKPVTAPRFHRILVTTDFSEGTPDALAYAFSVAQENEAEIMLLHVVHDVAADLSGKYREPLIKGIQKQLEDSIPPEARTWCEVSTRVETGLPYRVILRIIEDQKIDLLVMNIHGKGVLDRALLGSNAERVVRAASCPVMLIPPLKRKLRRRARPGSNRAA